eukprot:2458260-Prymnesium_polylepis.1
MGQNDAAGQWLFDGSTDGSLADAMRAVKSAAQCEATNCYEDGDEVDSDAEQVEPSVMVAHDAARARAA